MTELKKILVTTAISSAVGSAVGTIVAQLVTDLLKKCTKTETARTLLSNPVTATLTIVGTISALIYAALSIT